MAGSTAIRARSRGYVGLLAAGLAGLGAALVGWWLLSAATPAQCPQLPVALQLAGSDARLERLLRGCPGLHLNAAAVGWDFLFLAGYGLFSWAVLRLTWSRYYAPQLDGIKALVPWIPVCTAALDAIENVLILALVSVDPVSGTAHYAGDVVGGVAIATVAWLKWFGVAAVLVAVATGVFALGNGRRTARESTAVPRPYRPAEPPRVTRAEPTGARLGEQRIDIACSGGGIRATAFTLGVLRALEGSGRGPNAGPGIMARVATVAAVSGGGYAATAWMLTRATSGAADEDRAAENVHAWLRAPIVPGSPSRRHRYLLNSRSGIGRAVLLAIGFIVTNLAGLAALLAVLAWPVGRVLSSDVVRPDLRRVPGGAAVEAPAGIPPELGLPAAALAGLGGLAVVASLCWARASRLLMRTAVGLLGLAALLTLTFVGLPALIELLRGSAVGAVSPLAASGSALLGVAVAVWRIVAVPVVDRLLPIASRLGGVLLAAAALLFCAAVMNDSAGGDGLFGSGWSLLVAMGFATVFALFLNTNALSLQRLFRARLTTTFGLQHRGPRSRADAGGADPVDEPVFSPPTNRQVRWAELVDHPIELLLCCTQQSSSLGLGGFRANSFVISPRRVRVDDGTSTTTVATADYLALLPPRMWRFHSVVTWAGVSGAAFASAMGRLNLGSTNALLAASNIDLGTWLPNPKEAAAAAAGLPHIRLSYLIKEILGWYNTDDPYTFLTDGGHWDNLGLVELLRGRPRTVVCIDASADHPGTFATLRGAAALARLAIDDCDVRIDLTPLDDPLDGSGLAKDPVYCLPVRYEPADGGTPTHGTVVYAKAQSSVDMPVELRRFAAGDRRFPLYPTSDQFLGDDQFERLVELGEYVGAKARQAADRSSRAQSSTGSSSPVKKLAKSR